MTALWLLMPLLAAWLDQDPRPNSRPLQELLERPASSLPGLRQAGRAEGAKWTPSAVTPPAIGPLWQAAREGWVRGDLPLSLQRCWELFELQPAWPPALQLTGLIYYRMRRYGDAVLVLEAFLRAAPEEVVMARALGHSYYALGRYEQALALYRSILDLEPETPEALRGAALSNYRLGQTATALRELERLLELEARNVSAWNWRARLLFESEETDAALVANESARRLDPFDAGAWNLAGQILLELDRVEEAEAARQRFEVLEATAAVARNLEARLLFDPSAAELRQELVHLHLRQGDIARARAAARAAVRYDPRGELGTTLMQRVEERAKQREPRTESELPKR